MTKDSVFDILRLDVTWLSWFAEKKYYSHWMESIRRSLNVSMNL